MNEEVLKYVDKEIKEFIITINKFKDVETWSSCSGHSGRAYISFIYNESSNLKKVLNFFKTQGFKVKLERERYPIDNMRDGFYKYYEVLVDLTAKPLTSKKIEKFWDMMEIKLLALRKLGG